MPADLAGVLAQPDQGARLTTGIVTALPGGSFVTVNSAGQTRTIRRSLQYAAPAVGDVVLIATTGDGRTYAILALATGTSPVVPPAPSPPPATGSVTFPAAAAGTYRGGAVRTDRSDVLQGDPDAGGLNQGAWFYGTAPAATLAGATITAAKVYLDRRPGGIPGPVPIGLYLHNQTSPPAATPPRAAGPLTVTSLQIGEVRWVDLPAGWGQQIADGTAAGLGIYTVTASAYAALASLTQSGSTGALRMDWSR